MDIPGFKVKQTIGRGGMATAYLAIQESLGREVVLKVMHAGQADDTDFLERFINEGRIVAALNHPHIITIHDIGSANEHVYISMEYVEGGDLKAKIGEPLPPDEALSLMSKVGSALGYAHKRGIVHRDVKPANILFRADGTALLSDFGIAKQITVDNELTSTGTILGSPFYMSPEQSEGVVVDGRTDLYSMGVIFYEMLVGERPYQGDSAIKVIMQHIQSPLPLLPPELERFQPFLERLMAKDRDDRFANAEEMVENADQFLRGADAGVVIEESTPPEPEVPPWKSARPTHSSALRLGALLAALVIVVAAFGGFYFYAESLRPTIVVRHRPPPDATTTPLPAPTSTAPDAENPQLAKTDVVKALEWLASNSLREDRLTQPPADNALYYYSRLLDLDPRNPNAQNGFARIADRFVQLAEQEYSQRNYGKAQAYIALGLQVEPQNESLMSLQNFIDGREKSAVESFLDFFRSSG